jgi:hypothetical protein
MKTKFNIKITWNQIPRVKNKIQLEKKNSNQKNKDQIWYKNQIKSTDMG